MKFWNFLMLVSLFVLPLQTVYLLREPFIDGVKWEYGIVAIYGIDLLLVCILFLISTSWLRSIKYQVSSIKYGGAEILLMLLAAWVGVSVFWAPDQILASYFFVKLLLAIGLFFVVRGTKIDIKKVMFVLLAAGVIQSGIGIMQFLSQQSMDSSILGMSAHEAFQAGSSVLKIDSGRFLRAYGTFPHPNVLGGFLGAILVLGISYYVFQTKIQDTRYEIQDYFSQSAYSVAVIFIFLGLILTFSRAAWLGVGIGIIVYYVSCIRYQVWEMQMRFFKMMVALGLASIVFGFILHDQVFPRFDTKAIEREGSVAERIISFQDAQKIIADHPLIGIGAGNFTAEIIKGDEMGIKGEKGEMGERGLRPVWSIQPAHNVFVLIFSELGIVGLVLFLIFLGSISWKFYKGPSFIWKRTVLYKKENAIFGIAILVFIPSLFLDHFLWSSHFGLLFFFLFLGFASRR